MKNKIKNFMLKRIKDTRLFVLVVVLLYIHFFLEIYFVIMGQASPSSPILLFLLLWAWTVIKVDAARWK